MVEAIRDGGGICYLLIFEGLGQLWWLLKSGQVKIEISDGSTYLSYS